MSHPVTRIRWSFTSWAPTPWAFKALSVSSVAVRDYMRTHKVPSSGSSDDVDTGIAAAGGRTDPLHQLLVDV